MKRNVSIPALIAASLVLVPNLASAHIIPGTTHGLREGLVHPWSGLDHLLAMIAVGLWAAQHRGAAVWRIPLAFVSVMALGGVLGLSGASVPGVEFGIALSVLVLGALIATATQFKTVWSMALVGGFALFHGFAHGHEMPAAVSALPFSIGFLLSTLALHGVGISVGLSLQQQPRLIRIAGLGIAACAALCFAGLSN